MTFLFVAVANAQVKVIYFTKDKTMDASSGPDPILAMLEKDTRFSVTVNKELYGCTWSEFIWPGHYCRITWFRWCCCCKSGRQGRSHAQHEVLCIQEFGLGLGLNLGRRNCKCKVFEGKETHSDFQRYTITGGLIATFKRLQTTQEHLLRKQIIMAILLNYPPNHRKLAKTGRCNRSRCWKYMCSKWSCCYC